MKKTILVIFLFVFQYTIAQDKTAVNIANPVYHALRESEQIERVKTDKNATTLYFCVNGDTGTWEKFLSCSYLMDEQGKRHHIVGTKNIHLNQKTYLGKKRQLRFRVAFEPLPAGTKRSDLITDAYLNGGGGYYGIREKGLPLIAPNSIDTLGTYQAVARIFPDSIFREDTVWLSGQIENYKTLKDNIEKIDLYLMRNYQTIDNYCSRRFQIKVDSLGKFNAQVPVIGPFFTQMNVWTKYPDYIIPIMIYPGDHLKIRICDLDKDTQHVVYESDKGDFNNLLNHCPVFYSPSDINYAGNIDSLDVHVVLDAVSKHVDEMDTLIQYIAKKYGMDKAETQLLRTEANANTVANFIYAVNEIAQKKCTKKLYGQLRHEYPQSLLDSLVNIASHPCYHALSLLHADDNTFMVANSYNFVFYSLLQSPMKAIKSVVDTTRYNENENLYENYILNNDNDFTDFVCTCAGRNLYENRLFRQSFLLNTFINRSENYQFKGAAAKDVYARICAQKSRQITLPALQGLLKVAQKNFIE